MQENPDIWEVNQNVPQYIIENIIPRHVDTPDVDLGTSVTPSGERGDCRFVTGDRRVTSREAVIQESSSRGSDASSDDDDGPPECLFCWY